MATYVNDLRLKEIATGDESGTWGTSTNTNLELIGEAVIRVLNGCFDCCNTISPTIVPLFNELLWFIDITLTGRV